MLVLPVLARLLPLSLLLLAAACQPRHNAPVVLKQLEGTWLLSQEENIGDTLVYRPNTYNFPPARGRTGFAIKPYGRFEQFDIAPTDGLAGHPGTWVVDNGPYLRIHLNENPEPDYLLELISLRSNVLKVRKLPVPSKK